MNKFNLVLISSLRMILEFFKVMLIRVWSVCWDCRIGDTPYETQTVKLKDRYKGIKGLDGDKEDKDE